MKLSAFTALEGAKVRLRRFTPGDITPSYLSWLNDPVVTRFSNQRFRSHTQNTCEDYCAGFNGSPHLFLSVQDKLSDAAIGTMTAYANPHHGVCDVGIMIGARDCWSGGYGQDAWDTLTRWLLSEGGVRKLTAGCLATNAAMVRLMQRSGMEPDGVRARQEMVEGEAIDIVHYAAFSD